MNKRIATWRVRTGWIWIAALAGLATGARAQDWVPERTHPCGLHKMRALSPYFHGGAGIDSADTDTDVRHYKLDIEVLPSQTRVQGTSTVTLDSTVDGLSSARL